MNTLSSVSSKTPDIASTSNANVKNVVETAAANGSFKTFGNALRRSGLAETLKGEGPFTLFAPTDAAFEKLPAGQLDNWMKPENKHELMDVMNYHVVAGNSSAADIGKLAKTETLHGQSAPIALSGSKVTIDGARLTTPDIASSNGVLHGIDKVNIPAKQ